MSNEYSSFTELNKVFFPEYEKANIATWIYINPAKTILSFRGDYELKDHIGDVLKQKDKLFIVDEIPYIVKTIIGFNVRQNVTLTGVTLERL